MWFLFLPKTDYNGCATYPHFRNHKSIEIWFLSTEDFEDFPMRETQIWTIFRCETHQKDDVTDFVFDLSRTTNAQFFQLMKVENFSGDAFQSIGRMFNHESALSLFPGHCDQSRLNDKWVFRCSRVSDVIILHSIFFENWLFCRWRVPVNFLLETSSDS